MTNTSILDRLNPEQRAVVTCGDGPVLVVAGPGSGKTTTLVRRVAWLVDQGADPSGILLLTFTRAAAQIMVNRARGLAPKAQYVVGGTFHAIAARILRDLHESFGLPASFVVLDPEDAKAAMRSVIERVPFPEKKGAPRVDSVAGILSLEANMREGLEAAVLRKDAHDLLPHLAWLGQVQEAFVHHKVDRGMVDYDDLLSLFAIMANDAEIGPLLRTRFPRVLIDEHQDSNRVQLDIIYGLGGDAPNVMAVGDPAQSIYGFRGTAPATMFDFTAHWPQSQVLRLDTNYRSTGPIVAVVNAIDHAMSPRFDRTLQAASQETAEQPRLIGAKDVLHQAEMIGDGIMDHHTHGGAWSDHAVLVRGSAVARPIEAALTARGIPYVFVGGLRIDEAAHIKDLLSVVRVAENPLHDIAWQRSLALLPGLGPKRASQFAEQMREQQGTASERLRTMAPGKYDPATLQGALEALESIPAPGDALRAATLALSPVFLAHYKDEWPHRLPDMDSLATIADACSSLADFLTRVTLDYSLDRKTQGSPEADGEAPVVISTIHSAKGLEWPIVHIPGLISGTLPSGFARDAREMEEELRIFYVAASRAKTRLLMYKPVFRPNFGMMSPSSFEGIIKDTVQIEPPPAAVQGPALSSARVIDLKAALLRR